MSFFQLRSKKSLNPLANTGAVGGDQDVTGAFISAASVLFAAVLAYGVVAPTITSGSTLTAPEAAYELAPPTIASASAVYTPTVVGGLTTLLPPTIASGSTVANQSVSYELDPPAIDTTATLATPALTFAVTNPAIASGNTLATPSLGYVATNPLISTTATLYGADVEFAEPDDSLNTWAKGLGRQMSPALVARTGSINPIARAADNTQSIDLPTVPSSSQLSAPDVERDLEDTLSRISKGSVAWPFPFKPNPVSQFRSSRVPANLVQSQAIVGETIASGNIVHDQDVRHVINVPVIGIASVATAPSVSFEVNAPTIGSTSQAFTQSVSAGALTPTIASSTVVNAPTVAMTVLPPAIGPGTTLAVPTVSQDPNTLGLPAIPAASVVFTPTLTGGGLPGLSVWAWDLGQALTPMFGMRTGSLNALGATPSNAQSVDLPTISSGSVLTGPSVARDGDTSLSVRVKGKNVWFRPFAPNPIMQLRSTIEAPGLVSSQFVVLQATISSGTVLNVPAVGTLVSPIDIPSGNVLFAPSVAFEIVSQTVPSGAVLTPPSLAYEVVPPSVVSTALSFTPTLVGSLEPATIASGAALFAPVVAPESADVAPPTIVSTLNLFSPTLSGGVQPGGVSVWAWDLGQAITPLFGMRTGSINALSATATNTQSIDLPTVSSGSTLLAPSVARDGDIALSKRVKGNIAWFRPFAPNPLRQLRSDYRLPNASVVSQAVAVPTIGATSSVSTPTVIQLVSLPTITSTVVLTEPSLEYGIAQPLIVDTSDLFTPLIGLFVENEPITSGEALSSPELEFLATVPLILSGGDVNAPAIGNVIDVPYIAATSFANSQVIGFLILSPTITGTPVLYGPILVGGIQNTGQVFLLLMGVG